MNQYQVFPVDGYNKPKCKPVYVRASNPEKAAVMGRELLKVFGIRRMKKVVAKPYNPLLDPAWAGYIKAV